MKAKSIALLFVLIFWSCNSKEKNFSKELSGENLIKLDLVTLDISLKVPQNHSIFEHEDKCSINLNPQGRTLKEFSITKSNREFDKDEYKEVFLVDNGALFKYYVFEESGGSGGTEYQLKGILEFEKELYLIKATDQREFDEGDPEFCLKYLSTIKRLTNNPAQI